MSSRLIREIVANKNVINRRETRIIRKNNFHDYSFDDWEETTPLLYFDVEITIAPSANISTPHPDTEFTTPEYSTDATESDVPDTTLAQPPDVKVTTEVESTTDVQTTTDISITTESEHHNVQTDTETSVVTETTTNADIILSNETITSSGENIINKTSDVTTPSDTHNTDSKEATDNSKYTETTDIPTTKTVVTEEEDVLYYYLTTTTEAGLILTPPDIIINSTMSSTMAPTVSPLILEVKNVMESLKYGYFTSLLITLMRVVASKEDTALEPLKKALHDEINKAQMGNRLDMFGQIAANVIGELSEMWSLAPSDFVKTQASFLYVSLSNRKSHYSPEVNAIFDLIDNAYTADDAMSVISCIAEIEAFPNTTQSAHNIAANLLLVGIFIPYEKIRGTTKEKLLLMEIENIITQRMAGPMSRRKVPYRKRSQRTQKQLRKPISTRKRKLMRSQKRKVTRTKEKQPRKTNILKESTQLKVNMYHKQINVKQRQLKRLRGRQTQEHPISSKIKSGKEDNPIRLFDFFGTTKLTSTTDVDLDYLRNETIMEMLREKMKLYKKKWKRIRKKENRTGIKRGKTTTTTTTTTTIKPKMHKSKYYMRKYVKKNLYRMKTTTPSTTTKTKWFRKRYYETDIRESLNSSCSSETSYSSINSIEDDKHNIRNVNDNTLHTNKKRLNTETIRDRGIRIAFTKNNRKVLFRNNLYERNKKTSLMNLINDKYRAIPSKVLRNIEHSDYSNDEKELKANVLDALVHGRDHDLEVYKDRRRYNSKMAPVQSNSNEEIVLKANIYKAFGYDNNFAERLKM